MGSINIRKARGMPYAPGLAFAPHQVFAFSPPPDLVKIRKLFPFPTSRHP